MSLDLPLLPADTVSKIRAGATHHATPQHRVPHAISLCQRRLLPHGARWRFLPRGQTGVPGVAEPHHGPCQNGAEAHKGTLRRLWPASPGEVVRGRQWADDGGRWSRCFEWGERRRRPSAAEFGGEEGEETALRRLHAHHCRHRERRDHSKCEFSLPLVHFLKSTYAFFSSFLNRTAVYQADILFHVPLVQADNEASWLVDNMAYFKEQAEVYGDEDFRDMIREVHERPDLKKLIA